jgi:hypothetical protein
MIHSDSHDKHSDDVADLYVFNTTIDTAESVSACSEDLSGLFDGNSRGNDNCSSCLDSFPSIDDDVDKAERGKLVWRSKGIIVGATVSAVLVLALLITVIVTLSHSHATVEIQRDSGIPTLKQGATLRPTPMPSHSSSNVFTKIRVPTTTIPKVTAPTQAPSTFKDSAITKIPTAPITIKVTPDPSLQVTSAPTHLAMSTGSSAPSARCPTRRQPEPFPGKKGVCLVLSQDETDTVNSWKRNLPRVLLLDPYWNYSWSLTRIPQQPTSIEFVPMAWGVWDLDDFQATLRFEVAPYINQGLVKRILGYNEPDRSLQSNLDVDHALSAWPSLESYGLPLISPSAAEPLDEWMIDFMQEADQTCLEVDWVGVHWYGNANFDDFVAIVTETYNTYRRPIVVTEFATADWDATTVENNQFSPQKVLDFMQKAVPWLEATEWIAGYAWFSFDISDPEGTSSALFDVDGNLTPLGEYYASVRTNNPKGNQTISYRF